MTIDNKQGDKDMKITIAGEEFDLPEKVVKHIEGLKDKSKDMEEEKEAMEEEKEAMDTKLDTLQASLDAAKANKTNDTDIAKLVGDRVELLKMADSLGDKIVCKPCMDNMTIKKVIVDSMDGLSSDGKSEAYLDAIIDMKKTEMVDKDQRKQDAKDSHDAANGS